MKFAPFSADSDEWTLSTFVLVDVNPGRNGSAFISYRNMGLAPLTATSRQRRLAEGRSFS